MDYIVQFYNMFEELSLFLLDILPSILIATYGFIGVYIYITENLSLYPEISILWKILVLILFCIYKLDQHNTFFGPIISNYLILGTTVCFVLVFFFYMSKSSYFCSLSVCENTKIFDYKKFFSSHLKTFFVGFIISIGLFFAYFISLWYLGVLATFFCKEELYAIGLSYNFIMYTLVLFFCISFLYTEGLKITHVAYIMKDVYLNFPKAKQDILIICISFYTILQTSPKLVVCLGILCFAFDHIFLLCLVVYGLVLICFWVNLPLKREKLLNKYSVDILQRLSFNHWSTPIIANINVITPLVIIITKVLFISCFFSLLCITVLCEEVEDSLSTSKETPLKVKKVLYEDPHKHKDDHDLFAETFVPYARSFINKSVETLNNVLDTAINGSFVACAASETLAVSGTHIGPVMKGLSKGFLGIGAICLGAKGALAAGNFSIDKIEEVFSFTAPKALKISPEGANELGEIAVKEAVASTSRTFDMLHKALNDLVVKPSVPVQEQKAILAQSVTDFPVDLLKGSNQWVEGGKELTTTNTNLLSYDPDFKGQTNELVKDQVVTTFSGTDCSINKIEDFKVDLENSKENLSLKSKTPLLKPSKIAQKINVPFDHHHNIDDDKSDDFLEVQDFSYKNRNIKDK